MINNTTDYNQVAQELFTIQDFIRWAMSEFERVPVFYGHGTDNAWDEALQLILPALHLPIDTAPELFATRLLMQEKIALADLVRRRTQERIPVAYLTHQAPFAGLNFYVNEHVLIPRSPLAEIIEQRFEPWISPGQNVSRILDIGTGSACIACACAMAFPEAHIDAVDISAAALAVAKQNVEKLGLTEHVTLIHSDIFSALKNQQYDIIVSNPPYVDAAEMAALPPEYLHEPCLGLASGEDGLDHVRIILQQAKTYLKPTGLLVIEVGYSADALIAALPELPFTWIDLERGGLGIFMLYAKDLA